MSHRGGTDQTPIPPSFRLRSRTCSAALDIYETGPHLNPETFLSYKAGLVTEGDLRAGWERAHGRGGAVAECYDNVTKG